MVHSYWNGFVGFFFILKGALLSTSFPVAMEDIKQVQIWRKLYCKWNEIVMFCDTFLMMSEKKKVKKVLVSITVLQTAISSLEKYDEFRRHFYL